MAAITIDDTTMTVEVQGLDKLWALTSRLAIPLAHVRGATIDPGIVAGPKGWKGGGSHIRGVIVAGTFHQDGDRVFWDVHNGAKAIVIELEDESYRRLVVEVSDPRATVDEIERAIVAR